MLSQAQKWGLLLLPQGAASSSQARGKAAALEAGILVLGVRVWDQMRRAL